MKERCCKRAVPCWIAVLFNKIVSKLYVSQSSPPIETSRLNSRRDNKRIDNENKIHLDFVEKISRLSSKFVSFLSLFIVLSGNKLLTNCF